MSGYALGLSGTVRCAWILWLTGVRRLASPVGLAGAVGRPGVCRRHIGGAMIGRDALTMIVLGGSGNIGAAVRVRRRIVGRGDR